MKYLVNRETKEHRVFTPADEYVFKRSCGWEVVEADEEGWIKWEGGECPLPDDCKVDIKMRDNYEPPVSFTADCYRWNKAGDRQCRELDIIAYRPILDKPEEKKPLPQLVVTRNGVECADQKAAIEEFKLLALKKAKSAPKDDLIAHLKSAHEAAQRIPEIEAELREVLGAMGYDLVARSPFVERTDSESDVVEPESGTETPQDMSDWRNWKPGDLVERVRDPVKTCAELGGVYRLTSVDTTGSGTERAWYISKDGSEVWSSPNNFRFHSRPEVKS